MARLIPGVTPTSIPRRADPLTDLTLLLSRLQRTILHADAEREARLRESDFEREKAHANIHYARSLLTKLEQEALAIKIHSRRQDAQADLVRKKEVLDQLSERLSDLAEFAAARSTSHGDHDDDTSDGEDLLADIIATPSESMNSTTSPDMPPEEPDEPSDEIPSPLEPPSRPPPESTQQQTNTTRQPEQPSTSAPASTAPQPTTTTTTTTTTTQTLRPRHPEATQSTTSTSSHPPPQASSSTTTSALFPTHHQPTSHTTTAITTTEAILDHQRAEQDALSESILKLASDLKASSKAFSASLDEDREVVDRAGQGITRTGQNMEGVTRTMGMLQRMTEGEGWWGRMRLYAIVYGLMVVLVLVVFVLPKLRF
ncbi:hypothetical protein F5144DRAFT_630930 [Chaetomium tenue]|uniref:Uncharacterized protein n=1 Tax=Chaetomium tenue TaxID=1854479 RepID=A0ACB7P392_9PEZI|nr:hypothetical protein F5144DRAFT_630930 [Chaetomium globosum]